MSGLVSLTVFPAMELLVFLDEEIIGQFTNPRRRLFLGYLASALLIALFWLVFLKRQSFGKALATLFSKEIWMSRSTRFDVIAFLINRVIFTAIRPALITQVAVATSLYYALHEQSLIPIGLFSDAPYVVAASLFTIFFFLFDDFARFFTHMLLHKVPALWEFHKFHHSAESLTPLTVTRAHPVEGLIFTIRSALVQGISIGLFIYLFGNEIGLITIFGVNAFVVFFHGLGSNLRHSHIPIRYPKAVEIVLMSPAQHQLHHSDNPLHFDKNFGVALSLWDWICGTFHHSTDKPLKFGLGSNEQEASQSIMALYLTPFKSLGKRLIKGKQSPTSCH